MGAIEYLLGGGGWGLVSLKGSQVRPAISDEIRGSEHDPGKWGVGLPKLSLHLEDRMGEGTNSSRPSSGVDIKVLGRQSTDEGQKEGKND